MIKVSNLNKYYNRRSSNEIHVINNTSVEFDKTGLVCILGESGSGKTTLMNAIGGLDNYSSGELTIGDTTVSGYKAHKMDTIRNNHYGYIFQNYYLLQDRTVYYNIELALNMYDLTPEEREERILYVLKAVNMEKYRKRKVNQLSGGQQQRVAIARALAKTPDVIFADEPTGNLDEKNTIQIMNIIKKVSKECLVVLVTHEKNIAEFYADRIINVEDGKIISDRVIHESGVYSYEDDNNFYLQDMEEVTNIDNEHSSIKIYSDNSNKNKKFKLDIIVKNGRVYLSSSDEKANIEFLDKGDERKVINGHKQVMTKEDVEEFEYSLNKLETKKAPRLSFKEVLKLAYGNFKAKSKRNIFMYISLILTAIVSVSAVGYLLSFVNYNPSTISSYSNSAIYVKSDSNVLFSNFAEDIISNKNDNLDMHLSSSVNFTIASNDFVQLNDTTSQFEMYNYFDSAYLKESNLTAGRLPQNNFEMVVDSSLLSNIIRKNDGISAFYPTPISFLNNYIKKTNRFSNDYFGKSYQIVGISNLNNCAFYLTREGSISIGTDYSFMTLSRLKAAYPGQFDGLSLASGHILISDSIVGFLNRNATIDTIENGSIYGSSFAIDNVQNRGESSQYTIHLPDGCEGNVIINDDSIDDILKSEVCYSSRAYVYSTTGNKNEVYSKVRDYNNDKSYSSVLLIDDRYDDYIASYENTINEVLAITVAITGVTLIVAIVFLYFTMKANSLRRIYDIGVYRSIGISKGSIYLSFIIEILLISLCSSFIGGLFGYAVIQLVGSIPMISINVGLSFGYFLLTVLGLFAINILIGILPVFKLLRMTPANLTAKYDM